EGRVVLLMPPKTAAQLNARDRAAAYDSLCQEVCRYSAEKKARFAQIILGEEEQYLAPLFGEHGFALLTDLVYMKRPVAEPVYAPAFLELTYEPYDAAERASFIELLKQTYGDSLDCPELAGLRTFEEVLESHSSQGTSGTQHWRIAKDGAQTVGVVLAAHQPDDAALEIVYLGVPPEKRHKGYGRELVRFVLRLAGELKAEVVNLAVDARNQPARLLYVSEGFEAWDERKAFLLVLDPADGVPRSIATEN
ncbi:MAG: GNAT family N-acetyltransferase, partial [Planctomycetia bacterium]